MQEVDDVKVVDHRVGQLDKRLDDPLLSGHNQERGDLAPA